MLITYCSLKEIAIHFLKAILINIKQEEKKGQYKDIFYHFLNIKYLNKIIMLCITILFSFFLYKKLHTLSDI